MKNWFVERSAPELWHVATTLAILVAFYFLAHVVRLLWRRLFLPIARRTSTELDQLLLQRTERPVFLATMAAGAHLGMQRLVKIPPYATSFVAGLVEEAVSALFILAVATVAYGVLSALAVWYLREAAARTETDIDVRLTPVFTRLLKVFVFFVAATVVLDHFDIKITAVLGAAGVASLAVALAAQETIANTIAGFAIMADRPFRVGDRVELGDGRIGDVQAIGLRSTKILSFNSTMVVIPNSEIAKSAIVNHSYPDPRFQVRSTIGVAYGTDPVLVRRVLTGICTEHPKVLRDPEPSVLFTEFADSSLNFLVCFWIADYRDRLVVLDAIHTRIVARFAAEGIEIPFPQRVVHLRAAAPAAEA